MKKILSLVIVCTMVLGMLTVAAQAADGDVTVKVIWDGAGTESTSLYGWNGGDALGGWPGTEMTAEGEGVYTLTFTPSDITNLALIPNNSLGQTVDLTDIDASSGYVTITIGAAGDDGKFAAEVDTTAPTDSSTGVSTPVAVAAIAVVSMVGIVVFAKRRTVAE